MDLSVKVASPFRMQEEFRSKAENVSVSVSGKKKYTKGGWKIMPFIIGNESCANLAVISISANLVVFLTTQFHMDQVTAARITTIWGGVNAIAPIVGAFIADSYLGRFWTIVFASVTYILSNLITRMLREGKSSKATVSTMLGLSFVVYIQSNVSWSWGFGLATVLMVISTGFFLLGTNYYVFVSPAGSALTGFVQVIVASISKRNLVLPSDARELYYLPLDKEIVDLKVCVTDQFKFLNKAAVTTKEDYKENASTPNPWRLCPVQKIEDLKSMISALPIWSAGIIASLISQGTSYTYMIYQAKLMHRKLGPHFEIPAASFSVFSLLAMSLWLPIYDRFVLPFFRRLTKRSQGITLIERTGTGLLISVLTMAVAAVVEVKRRNSKEGISVFWLVPQHVLQGLAEAFYVIGMIEFFYWQFPKSMRSAAVALFWCSLGIGLLLSSVVITLVHKATGGDSQKAWLAENLNDGRLEYFYWLYAGFAVLNLFYFLVCVSLVRRLIRSDHDENEGKEEVELCI